MLIFEIIITLLGYSFACFGAGILALGWLCGRAELIKLVSPGTLIATAFTLGQGILASLWLLLALPGWFSPSVVFGILLVCVLGGFVNSWFLSPYLARQLSSIGRELSLDSWGWQTIAALTILSGLAWITSIGRPLSGDATAFYMALPKVIAASQRLVPLPGYEGYTNIGLQGELHYSVFMMLDNPDAARLFAWPTIVAGAVLLSALGRHVGLGRRGQWITLALFFSSSAIVLLSGDGKVDAFAVPQGLAAYYWIILAPGRAQRLALWLTGLFSGFAIAAKFSYIPVMAPGLLLLLFWGFRDGLLDKSKRKQTFVSIIIASCYIAAGLLISIAPQLLKNTIFYQNPIAPFGVKGIGWAKQVWFGVETTRRIVLSYPFALTFGSYFGQYGNISPLVLAFMPLAVLLPRPRSLLTSTLAAVTISAFVGLLAWIMTQPSVLAPRYILATLLLFLLLPARAAEYVSHNDTRPRWLTVGIMLSTTVMMMAMGLYTLNYVFYPKNTFEYLVGKINECDRDGPYCQAMSAVNRDAGPGDRVYLATYYRYWLRPDLLQCISEGNYHLEGIPGNTDEKRWLKLYQDGFKYLIVDRSSQGPFLDDMNLESPPAWLNLSLLYQAENLAAYRLDFHDPPTSQLQTCRQIHFPAWDVARK